MSAAPTVDELAARARDGDREAFAHLVVLTSPSILALARRLVGNDHDAHDVLQETYLRAFRSIGRFRGESSATTWLYRICANCAATALRRRGWSRRAEVDEALSLADPRAERLVDDAASGPADRERLRRALHDLPDLLRAVVVLRDVYDLPHEAIARELGISRGAAKVRLHRARRRLRELLPPLGEQHPPRRSATGAAPRPIRRPVAGAGAVGGTEDDPGEVVRAVGL